MVSKRGKIRYANKYFKPSVTIEDYYWSVLPNDSLL